MRTKQLFLVMSLGIAIATTANAQTVEFVFANPYPEADTQNGVVGAEWIRRVEEATEGRVKIRHVAGGALLNPPAVLNGVRDGVADIGPVSVTLHSGELPISSALAGALDVEIGSKIDLFGINAITHTLYNEFPEFQEEYNSRDLRSLFWVPSAQHSIITTTPITSLEELKDKKIRTFGTASSDFINALGGVPIAIAFGEVYTSLQTGVIDGAMTNPTAMIPARFHEVTEAISTFGPGYGTSWAISTVHFVISEASWNELSERDQQILDQISREMVSVGAEIMTTAAKETYEALQDAGLTVHHLAENDPSKMAAMLPDYFAAAAEQINDRGLPGTAIIARYHELAEDYLSGEWRPTF